MVNIELDDVGDIESIVIRGSYGLRAWFESYAVIRDKDARRIEPKLNALQKRVCDAVEWCLKNGQPVRLVILKPRQKGSSTISVAAVYWFMCVFGANGVVIGGKHTQTANMWEILKRYAKEDGFDWGFSRPIKELSAEFTNGARMTKETARNEEAVRSDTIQALLATEAARWKKGNVAKPEAVIGGALNCLPDKPNTIAILDSTANGASGFYYNKWEGARWLEDRKKGDYGNGWIRVFAGWYEFDDSFDNQLPEEQIPAFIDSYDEKEQTLVQEYDLHPRQVSWRRKTIRDNCDGDPAMFDMDFPGCPEDAFRASSPSRFNGKGISLLRREALLARPDKGTFEQPDPNQKRYVFAPSGEGDHFEVMLYEPPATGCRYILPVDTMTGEFAGVNLDSRDHHVGMVLRDGYWDHRGMWKPPKLVARTNPKCQWDIDILEEVVWRLSQHYGGCMIVPEENQDRGLIRGLRDRGALLYSRKSDDDQTASRESKPTNVYGFRTKSAGENNKKIIIEKLARAIRSWGVEGDGIDIPDLATVAELETFIVHEDGREAAAGDKHDDAVITLSIGLATIAGATKYMPRDRVMDLPPDLAALERRNTRKVRQYS